MKPFLHDKQPETPKSALEDLLAAHADALTSGKPLALSAERLSEAEQAEAQSLMLLAERLSAELTPVTPDPAFVARLRTELLAQAPARPTLLLRWRNLPKRYKVAARIGGLTLTAGLALLASSRVLELLLRAQRRQQAKNADLSLTAVS
ncbi:MAG: hypothetical protein RML95_10845 [Anaerolineae bacterium]|nr:hypothetical protein [Anaerolineae bacterium]MDW8299821.1 hypothetical protein [Anaerolineae bacterium]